MFIDKTKIYVAGGKGGDGCMSFRREKFIPFGGPNGGNGGRGGSVYMQADQNMTTLMDLSFRPHFRAQEGMPGQTWDKAGLSGEDLVIYVPCGTIVFKDDVKIHDLSKHGEKILLARGGRGGRGNSSFKTIRNTAPRISEKGEPGEETSLILELKMIADVGLVGFPNAGKSTLLSRISKATPKIADYPFTTLSPNLGLVRHGNAEFVVADIPGIIEGAHSGKGLGTAFLRHIERTRVLVHVIDCMGFNNQTPYKNYQAILKELKLYSSVLAKKPMIIALNKIDCDGSDKVLKEFKTRLKGKKIYSISAVSGKGLTELFNGVLKLLEKNPVMPEQNTEESDEKRYILEESFEVVQQGEGRFRLVGKKVERLAAMTNFGQKQSVRRFQNILKKMGVEKMLKRHNVQDGDLLQIGKIEFEYTSEAFGKKIEEFIDTPMP